MCNTEGANSTFLAGGEVHTSSLTSSLPRTWSRLLEVLLSGLLVLLRAVHLCGPHGAGSYAVRDAEYGADASVVRRC